MDDADGLVRRVRAGETEAFAELVRRFERPVWRVVAAMLQDFGPSADVMQQVFVDAYTRLAQYRLDGTFEGWVKAIARNRVRQELRRLGREAAHLAVYREHLERRLRDGPAGDRHREAYLDALRTCRDGLPEEAARVVRMRYAEGKAFGEIADLVGTTAAAVEKLLSRVRVGLRACIERRLADS